MILAVANLPLASSHSLWCFLLSYASSFKCRGPKADISEVERTVIIESRKVQRKGREKMVSAFPCAAELEEWHLIFYSTIWKLLLATINCIVQNSCYRRVFMLPTLYIHTYIHTYISIILIITYRRYVLKFYSVIFTVIYTYYLSILNVLVQFC